MIAMKEGKIFKYRFTLVNDAFTIDYVHTDIVSCLIYVSVGKSRNSLSGTLRVNE